jgi:two-component system sensor histidine kinase RpfC
VSELLDLSRIEAGRSGLVSRPFALAPLLAQIEAMAASLPRARQERIRLGTFVGAGVPGVLRGDAARLREVFLSLLDSAVKFTLPDGRVLLTVSADDGTAADGTARLRFELRDSGIGIDPAVHGRIFEPFVQADPAIAERLGGTGLGLAICAGLVRAMGGTIGVESEAGQGNTFWIVLTLPVEAPIEAEYEGADGFAGIAVVALGRNAAEAQRVRDRLIAAGVAADMGWDAAAALTAANAPWVAAVADASLADRSAASAPAAVLVAFGEQAQLGEAVASHCVAAVAASAADAEVRSALATAAAWLPSKRGNKAPTAPATEPLRVLVADDIAVNTMVTEAFLQRFGHSVILATNGEQALAALMRGEADLALLDVNMPVLSGIEVVRAYHRAVPDGRRVPVIGLTADDTETTQARCLEAGMVACVVKPVAMEILASTLATAATQPRRRPAQAVAVAVASADGPALDEAMLDNLVAVCGSGFLSDVVHEFTRDGTQRILPALRTALARGDADDFRTEAHALGSSAGHVGARRLHALCAAGQVIGSAAFVADGAGLLRNIEAEWARTCSELAYRVAGDGAKPAPAML